MVSAAPGLNTRRVMFPSSKMRIISIIWPGCGFGKGLFFGGIANLYETLQCSLEIYARPAVKHFHRVNRMLLKFPMISAFSMVLLMAHPLGNFSANHYMKFEVTSAGVEMSYVMDLAEIPTFELLRQWGLERTSPRETMDRQTLAQARAWMSNLLFQIDDHPVTPVLRGADLVIADGAGNLPIIRISARMFLKASGGRLGYEDRNYEGRAGWKEIVIAAGPGAHLENASQTGRDRSQALTAYPPDPMAAPPQDLRAALVWAADAPTTAAAPSAAASSGHPGAPEAPPSAPLIQAIPQPAARPAPPASSITAKNAPA